MLSKILDRKVVPERHLWWVADAVPRPAAVIMVGTLHTGSSRALAFRRASSIPWVFLLGCLCARYVCAHYKYKRLLIILVIFLLFFLLFLLCVLQQFLKFVSNMIQILYCRLMVWIPYEHFLVCDNGFA